MINFIENVKDIVDFYGFKQSEDPISNYYDFKDKKWNENSTEAVLHFFRNLHFFSRFEHNDLELIIEAVELEQFSANDVIFVNDGSVHIILVGEASIHLNNAFR